MMKTFGVEYVYLTTYEINGKLGSDQVTDLAILQLALKKTLVTLAMSDHCCGV